MLFIDSTNFERLLKKLSADGELYVPVLSKETGRLHIERVTEFPLPKEMRLDGFRTVDPWKGAAQMLRCPVANYPDDKSREISEEKFRNVVIVGARACDIYAFELVDRVEIEGEFTDPFYKVRRDKMFIIGADCTECGESCFCNLLGNKPWPEKGYDLNVSSVSGGYIVEAGSDKGKAAIEANKDLFSEARDEQTKHRDEVRSAVLDKLEKQNRAFPRAEEMPDVLRAALTDDVWDEIAAKCVECGACTNICPTCYCFLLYDMKADGEYFQRISTWDSCQVTGYARMAGMLNPRARLTDRVKHRYYHKYDYLVKSHGAIFCTGCGRCIDSCSATIDMRESFKKVSDRVKAGKR